MAAYGCAHQPRGLVKPGCGVIGTSTGFAVAMAAAGGGNVAVFLAAAADGSGAASVAPWLQGGGSAAAVAGLVYVARKIISGDLVPRAVADRENETAAAIRVSADRERALVELIGEGLAREKTLAKVSGEVVQSMADVTSELRWWRDQRERGRTMSVPPRRSPTVREQDDT